MVTGRIPAETSPHMTIRMGSRHVGDVGRRAIVALARRAGLRSNSEVLEFALRFTVRHFQLADERVRWQARLAKAQASARERLAAVGLTDEAVDAAVKAIAAQEAGPPPPSVEYLNALREEGWTETVPNGEVLTPTTIDDHADSEGGRQRPMSDGSPSGRGHEYILWGRHFRVDTYKQILLNVCAELYARHPSDFLSTVARFRGRKWFLVSPDPDQVSRAGLIPNSELFVNIHGNGETLMMRCHILLEAFGYHRSDLEFLFD